MKDMYVKVKDFLFTYWKEIGILIAIILIFSTLGYMAYRIGKISEHQEELKKPTVLTPEQARDKNYLENKLEMRKSDADSVAKEIVKAQTNQTPPSTTVVVQAPNPTKATEIVRERIEKQDPTMPKEALEKTDRTIVAEQPNNNEYKVGVYKIKTYKDWAIGVGVGTLDGNTYIPVSIHRQYKQNKSIEVQVNYSLTTGRVAGGQIMHSWHF